MKTPCKGCMSRHEACHKDCGKYLAYRAEVDKRREERLKEKMIKDAQYDLAYQASKRRTRRKHVDKR